VRSTASTSAISAPMMGSRKRTGIDEGAVIFRQRKQAYTVPLGASYDAKEL